jgi:hypothetical protein
VAYMETIVVIVLFTPISTSQNLKKKIYILCLEEQIII